MSDPEQPIQQPDPISQPAPPEPAPSPHRLRPNPAQSNSLSLLQEGKKELEMKTAPFLRKACYLMAIHERPPRQIHRDS